jgi:hypothetical protein
MSAFHLSIYRIINYSSNRLPYKKQENEIYFRFVVLEGEYIHKKIDGDHNVRIIQ